nr:hypothetical protein T26H5.2 - Caenorhabditis elegans [Caenorhabditis elegans]
MKSFSNKKNLIYVDKKHKYIFCKKTKIILPIFFKFNFLAIAFAVACLIPYTYILFSIIFEYYNQAGNNFIFIFLALHGLTSTVILLWAHKPYRKFCLQLMENEKIFRITINLLPFSRNESRSTISVLY